MIPLGCGPDFGVEFDDRPGRFRSHPGTPGPEKVRPEHQATFERYADDHRERATTGE